MALAAKNITLVCLSPDTDANELGALELPSYGIKRIQAAVIADPELADFNVRLIDLSKPDIDTFVETIVATDPDVIGISLYVWSTKCLVEVARRVKELKPKCLIIFGGPSARKEVFDLPIYPAPHAVLDAVVSSEGEEVFCKICRLPEYSQTSLKTISGIDLPILNGWLNTGPVNPIILLDKIASPYQLELMPKGAVAYLESFRGCPLSCRFCEWGATDAASNVFSTEYLIKEFCAFEEREASSVFIVDAGLNLNAKAFKNIQEAENETGFLQRTDGLWAEIYPTNIRDDHLEFLDRVGVSYLGIGLQSLDPAVLKDQDRPFNRKRFESAVRKLAKVAYCEIQIIMGLPGDSPEGFKRTLEFARSLPVGVRAYHCLVLPDALLTRSKAEWNVQFNLHTMAMTSCLGWSEEDLKNTRAYNDELAMQLQGTAGEFWWFFPPSLYQ